MFKVIAVMVIGVVVGRIIKDKRWVKAASDMIIYMIYLLLFVLGIAVGMNPLVMDNLGTIGVSAAIISAGAVLGSAAMAWLVFRYIFGGRLRRTDVGIVAQGSEIEGTSDVDSTPTDPKSDRKGGQQ